MPWGNGRFTRNQNWANDAAAGVRITTINHDDEDNNLATGIDNCLHKGGGNNATSDISMAGFKLTHVGTPSDDTDAVNLGWVNSMTGWSQSKAISGTDLNGRLNFTGPNGNNGLTFTTSDMSLLGKPFKALQTSNRIVINNGLANPTDSGTDVFIFDDHGYANFSLWSQNLSYSQSDGTWRTIAPGYGSYLQQNAGGFVFATNKTATATDPYVIATMTNILTLGHNGFMTLLGDKIAEIVLQMGDNTTSAAARIAGNSSDGQPYWLMQLGNDVIEAASNAGRDFSLLSYDNNGGYIGTALGIIRSSMAATFGGTLKVNGYITANRVFQSDDTVAILTTTGNGTVYLSPNGVANLTKATTVSSTNGDMDVAGSITCYSSNMKFGAGGQGKIWQMQSGWYMDFNNANGNLQWIMPGSPAHFGFVSYGTSGDFAVWGINASKQTAGQWISWSDERLKTIGQPYEHGLASILKLVPRHFKLKRDTEQRDLVGMIGQEIEQVMPDTVRRLEGELADGTKVDDLIQFDPTNIQYALINAVKELKAQLDEALGRIAALEAA